MQNDSLISIIVPVYNVESYLPFFHDSISNQTYTHFEAILVDDGSTDTSGVICDDYCKKDTRFTVIHQENQWLSGARNTGLSAAKGDFFCFVDSDDYIHPRYLEVLYNALEQTGCDVAMVGRKSTLKSGTYSDIVVKAPIIIGQDDMMKSLFGKGVKVVWNKLYKSHLKDLRFNTIFAEDIDYNVRLYLHIDNVAYVDTELYYFLIRPNSITHNYSYEHHHFTDLAKSHLFYLNHIPENKPRYRGYCIRRLIKIYLQAIYIAKEPDDKQYAHEQLDGLRSILLELLTQNPSLPYYEKVYLKVFINHPSTYAMCRWVLNQLNRLLH